MINKVISITLIIFFIACILTNTASADGLSFSRRIAYAPGQVIVKFQPGIVQMPAYLEEIDVKYLIINSVSLQNLNEKFGLSSIKRLSKSKNNPALEDTYVLKFSDNIDVIVVTKEYSRDANIIYARPNYIVSYHASIYKPTLAA